MKPTYTNKQFIVAGLISSKANEQDFLDPIEDFVKSAGGIIVGTLIQRRGISRSAKPGGAQKLDLPLSNETYISTGKAEELKNLCKETSCEAVIFINRLTNKQIEILAELTGCEVFNMG